MQAGAEHSRMYGPHKNNTCARMHEIKAKTNRLANEGNARAGRWKARAQKKDMQCKHPDKSPDVSLSLVLGTTSHKINATVENGAKQL